MPRLMAACDVMVENAGGLTANEAFAVGLPVVTFLPIAGPRQGQRRGHGRARRHPVRPHRRRAARRARPCSPGPARSGPRQIAIAHGLFVGDAADDVLAEAALRSARGIEQPIQMPKAPHRIRVAAGSMLALYGLLTLGAQGIAALGVGVAEPPKQAHDRVYLGVRLTADELASPRIRARLDRMHATAIIDATAARDWPRRRSGCSSTREIDVGNGGWGQGRAFRPLRAQADVISTTDLINKTADVKIREFVPERRFDAFDQLFARRRGQRLVQADHVIRPESVPARAARPRRVRARRSGP